MKLFLLILSPCFTDTCVEQERVFWVFENPNDCQLVADAMNKNADAEHLYCVPENQARFALGGLIRTSQIPEAH